MLFLFFYFFFCWLKISKTKHELNQGQRSIPAFQLWNLNFLPILELKLSQFRWKTFLSTILAPTLYSGLFSCSINVYLPLSGFSFTQQMMHRLVLDYLVQSRRSRRIFLVKNCEKVPELGFIFYFFARHCKPTETLTAAFLSSFPSSAVVLQYFIATSESLTFISQLVWLVAFKWPNYAIVLIYSIN